jgi:hypothetical protein
MKFNQKRATESAIDTGAAVVGAVGFLAIINKATAIMTEKSPNSAITRHLPALGLGLMIAAQAFDIVPDNEFVESALQGGSAVAGMQVVREYSGANTAAGRTATTGLQAMINQFVPGFEQDGVATAAAVAQVALPASTTGVNGLRGLRGVGNLTPYTDPAEAFRLQGEMQQMQARTLRTLGSAPANADGLKDLG